MTPEKIQKIINLANSGVGGEKENARRILTKLNISWKGNTIIDKIKEKVNIETRKYHYFNISSPSDILYAVTIVELIEKSLSVKPISVTLSSNQLKLHLTSKENEFFHRFYTNKKRNTFNAEMRKYAYKTVNLF